MAEGDGLMEKNNGLFATNARMKFSIISIFQLCAHFVLPWCSFVVKKKTTKDTMELSVFIRAFVAPKIKISVVKKLIKVAPAT